MRFLFWSVAVTGTASEPLSAQLGTGIRDSAGVTVVENGRLSEAQERFTLGRILFSVGGLESEPRMEFDARQGYLRGVALSDGSFAAIDVYRVHYFDSHGKRTRIVGNQGRGPEDFQYLTDICRSSHDSLLVFDTRNRRVSTLDRHGRVIRTTMIPLPAAYPVGCFGSSEILLSEAADRNNVINPSTTLFRMRSDGSDRQELATLQGRNHDILTGVGVRVTASDDQIYGGDPFQSELRIWSFEGALLRVIRFADRPKPVSASQLDSLYERAAPTNFSASERRAFVQRLSGRVSIRSWPIFRTFHVTPRGRLWLQRYANPDAPDQYWVSFDSAGRIDGSLRIPDSVSVGHDATVISFGDGEVLLRTRDSSGALRLTRFEVVATTPKK